MRLEEKSRLIFIALLIVSLGTTNSLFAQDKSAFTGGVNTNNINIRSDSTVSSEIICNVNKGERLEIVSGLYEWYKVKLPKNAPSFIKKNIVAVIEDKPTNSFDKLQGNVTQMHNAKVSKDRVNIRLHPNESSPILGRVNKNEIINILEDKGDWYRIEPVNNSFGWINNKFVDRISTTLNTVNQTEQIPETIEKNKITVPAGSQEQSITIEGMIRPYGMVIKRTATHKLITQDKKIYLLTGNKKSLDALNYHNVKVTGKIAGSPKQKYLVIEIETAEARD